MNSIDVLILNMSEVRRRSEIVWKSIDKKYYEFKPDQDALTIYEMIKHVLQSEYMYHEMFIKGGSIEEIPTPYDDIYNSIEELIIVSKKYKDEYKEFIKKLNEDDLTNIKIDRSQDAGYIRTIGDMIERVTFHEAVHLGQLLDYMRTAGIERPRIWD
ncbi:DinB family protein [Macrococcoides goetzii]|uniref:DinB family protein n=1 Tax=Macrococcoides goetzii TaxID=1891097 RepID=A0A2G5NTW6_9STAP|nr:DinB family protein [Macrococcus goetzii]RAI82679.1 DinB family protein [Macrococcus goetzii]